MEFEVTATRKRPQSLAEMVGQEFVVATLSNALETGQLAHAYLFSGPRGTGKTSTARILARSLNCETGPTAQPCGTCASCVEIAKGVSPDVIEIDGASNTSVNDVREIKDEVLYAPQSSRKKIYIIDEVHMLSNSAFNALLKTIEEPPPYIVFIFATTEVHKVPATIRSRCQQFRFRLFSPELIRDKLVENASELGRAFDTDALYWIAREAGGSMRDAYTLFDQVLSFSEERITLEGIREKMGLVGLEVTSELLDAAAAGNRKRALELLDEILIAGTAVEQVLVELADFLRNLTVLAYGVDKESILGLKADRFPQGPREAWDIGRLESATEDAFHLFRDIRYSLNPRYELELFIGRLCGLTDKLGPSEVLGRVAALRSELLNGTWEQEDKKKSTDLNALGFSGAFASENPAKTIKEPPQRSMKTEEESSPSEKRIEPTEPVSVTNTQEKRSSPPSSSHGLETSEASFSTPPSVSLKEPEAPSQKSQKADAFQAGNEAEVFFDQQQGAVSPSNSECIQKEEIPTVDAILAQQTPSLDDATPSDSESMKPSHEAASKVDEEEILNSPVPDHPVIFHIEEIRSEEELIENGKPHPVPETLESKNSCLRPVDIGIEMREDEGWNPEPAFDGESAFQEETVVRTVPSLDRPGAEPAPGMETDAPAQNPPQVQAIATPPEKTVIPASSPQVTSSDSIPNQEELKDLLIAGAKKANLTLASALGKAKHWQWREETLTLVFESAYEASLVKNGADLLRSTAMKAGHPAFSVETRVDVSKNETAEQSAGPKALLVQQVFRGQIMKGRLKPKG